MKYLVPAVLCLCLALTACGKGGSSRLANNPQAKADEAKAAKIFKACEPSDPTSLRTKSGRVKFEDCVFPVKNRTAGAKCIVNGLIGHLPTKARVERVSLTCIGRYA